MEYKKICKIIFLHIFLPVWEEKYEEMNSSSFKWLIMVWMF